MYSPIHLKFPQWLSVCYPSTQITITKTAECCEYLIKENLSVGLHFDFVQSNIF